MTIIARGPDGAENRVYTDPNPIVRGHEYQMNIQMTFAGNGTGTLKIWRDGAQIVNYTGPFGGGSGDAYYWKEGVYRAPGGTNTMVAEYRNLEITTGSAPAPSAPPQQTLGGTPPSSVTPPTTPTSPVTPPTSTRRPRPLLRQPRQPAPDHAHHRQPILAHP